jgi:hypothetical protein
VWALADTGVATADVAEVRRHLEHPETRQDPQLLLRGLIAKAILDRNSRN